MMKGREKRRWKNEEGKRLRSWTHLDENETSYEKGTHLNTCVRFLNRSLICNKINLLLKRVIILIRCISIYDKIYHVI